VQGRRELTATRGRRRGSERAGRAGRGLGKPFDEMQ